MSPPVRYGIGLLLLAVLAAFGYGLLNKGVYGTALFVLVPLFLGALGSWVYQPATGNGALGVGTAAVGLALLSFLLLGVEGLICIAMAAPLGLPLGAFGGWLAYRMRSTKAAPPVATMLVVLAPASVGWDVTAKPPVYEVHSSIEIAAPPEQVWKYIPSFPGIDAPKEWFFRAGLAYPIGTRMEGSGVGAARYCDLSTGPVVEQVEAWDEAKMLRFRVIESPAPMRELSPYGDIEPKHLHGYFLSKEGQFQLTRLPNNHTLLEGTSWYQHGLWPSQYWRWWSDAIVHRIHVRVLNHIKTLAEAPVPDR